MIDEIHELEAVQLERDLEQDDEPQASDMPPLPNYSARGPDDHCGEIAISRSLSRALRSRLLRREPLVLILTTPSLEWCLPVRSGLEQLLGQIRVADYSVTQASTRSDVSRSLYLVCSGSGGKWMPDISCKLFFEAIAMGASVFGISTEPELLPPEVRAAADATIEIRPLRGRDVMTIIRATTGVSRCPRISDSLAMSLNPTSIALAVRKGATPLECLRRLKDISARVNFPVRPNETAIVPDLIDAVGYGEASAWGLALKADIVRSRADPAAVSIEAITRSLLLVGPPGVGKTFFARILAKSCGIPLITTSYGEWQGAGTGHLGEVMGAMRKAFAEARQAAIVSGHGAILLIDEIDSVLGKHLTDGDRHGAWWASVGNALLTLSERDACERRGVVLLACTNYPDRIDPALTRSGRLDRTIALRPPTANEFADMLRLHLGRDLPNLDLVSLASLRLGMTGADAARLVRDARQAARVANRPLVAEDLVSLIMPSETRSPEFLQKLAMHEAAHVVVGLTLGVVTLDIVTLLSPSDSGAFARFRERADTQKTRDYYEKIALMRLAGRAIDDLSGMPDSGSAGGPGSDLFDVTSLVAALHRSFGLGDGLMTSESPGTVIQALRVDARLQEKVERDLKALYSRTKGLVSDHLRAIEAVAEGLVAKRLLTGDEVKSIVAAANEKQAERAMTANES